MSLNEKCKTFKESRTAATIGNKKSNEPKSNLLAFPKNIFPQSNLKLFYVTYFFDLLLTLFWSTPVNIKVWFLNASKIYSCYYILQRKHTMKWKQAVTHFNMSKMLMLNHVGYFNADEKTILSTIFNFCQFHHGFKNTFLISIKVHPQV